MTEPDVVTVTGPTRRNRRLRSGFRVLFGLNTVLLGMALVSFLQGDPDRYPHQHARTIVTTLLGTMLCAGYFTRGALQIGAMIVSVVAIAMNVWLASGYVR